MLLTNAIEQFIFHCEYEKKLDNKTIRAYRTDLIQFKILMEKEFNKTILEDLTKGDLKFYIKSLSLFKSKTSKRKLASIKSMFNFIDFENDDFVNPFHKLKIKIKEERVLPTVMSLPEISKILELLYKEYRHSTNLNVFAQKVVMRNIAIIELLFSTGIRVSELCKLSCSDIDFFNKNIRIFGKGSKERLIHIGQENVWNIMTEYHLLFSPTSYFFINRLGKQISPQSVRFLVKKYAQLANLNKHITPHTFRHSFATLLLEENVDIKYIQSLLGHSSILTTQVYTHVSTVKQKNILSTKHPRLKLNFNL